tara:strand:+ start:233 stop:1240 length:1008 start_codon:yes stop_codon:yes gene_type:complete
MLKFFSLLLISIFFLNSAQAEKIPKNERKDFDYFVLKDESKKSMVYNNRNVPKRDGLYRFHEDFEGERAIEINLSYSDIGHEMDWFRWNDPGFAQRYQIAEPLKKTTKKGKTKWYRVGLFIPGKTNTEKHTISFFDYKMIYGKTEMTVGPAFNLVNNEFTFFINGSKYNITEWRNGEKNYDFEHYGIALNSVYKGKLKGKWINVLVNAKWDTDGFIHMWIDGELRVSYYGDLIAGADKVRFKFGPYRHHMVNATNAGLKIEDLTLYYSNVGKSDKCENLWNGCSYLTDQITKKSQLNGVNHVALTQRFQEGTNQKKPENVFAKFEIDPNDPLPSM